MHPFVFLIDTVFFLRIIFFNFRFCNFCILPVPSSHAFKSVMEVTKAHYRASDFSLRIWAFHALTSHTAIYLQTSQ